MNFNLRFVLACIVGGTLLCLSTCTKGADEETVVVPKRLLDAMVQQYQATRQQNAEYEALLEQAAQAIEALRKKTNCT